MRSFINTLQAARRDDRGGVAIIFSLTAMIMFMAVGLAIDGGRAYQANSKVGSAIDAAALAAAKGMLESNLSDQEVTALAETYFQENMKGSTYGYVQINSFVVTVDRDNNGVEIKVQSEIPTTFGALAGVPKIDIPNETVAMFDAKDIELTLSLDMTGSMGGQKTQDLRTATRDLLDILLPDEGTTNKVRVGFAPFAAGVNAGSFAGQASGNRSPDGCVYEREGGNKTGDEAPSQGAYMSVAGDSGNTGTLNKCPSRASVTGLTESKDDLRRAVNDFQASGSTAGHLGTAWAWYMLSPNWSGVFNGDAEPAPYDDGKTIKAVVLMTDGQYNTYGGTYSGGNIAKSEADARSLCGNMKNKKVVVYSVGFQLPAGSAEQVMRDCANSQLHFFRAENGSQLRAAFRAIAVELNNLRITK